MQLLSSYAVKLERAVGIHSTVKQQSLVQEDAKADSYLQKFIVLLLQIL